MVLPGSSEPFSAVKNPTLGAVSQPLSQNVKTAEKPVVADFPDVVKNEPIRDQQHVQKHASFELTHAVNFEQPAAAMPDVEAEHAAITPDAPVHSDQVAQVLEQAKTRQEQGLGAVDAHQFRPWLEMMKIPMANQAAIVASQLTDVFATPPGEASTQAETGDNLEARLQANYARMMDLNAEKGSDLGVEPTPEQHQLERELLQEAESLRRQLADRLTERVLHAQASGGTDLDARKSGFEGAMAAITQLDQGSGLANAMQRIAAGQDLEGVQLNTQGGSNVALNLLRRIQPSVQGGALGLDSPQTRKTRQEMDKLANWSRQILEGRLPSFSSQDLQLLSDLGIGVSRGKLVNAGDGQELSRDMIQNLGHLATCTGIALADMGGMSPANVAMRDFLTKLTVAQEALDRVATQRTELTVTTESVEKMTDEVEHQTQLVDSTTEQLVMKQQAATVLADDLALTDEDVPVDGAQPLTLTGTMGASAATPSPSGTPAAEETVEGNRRGRRKRNRTPLWERPDPMGLRGKALERMGLRVSGSTGEPRQFFVDNKQVSEADFKQALQVRRHEGFKRLAGLRQDAHSLGVVLQQQHQDLTASTERLTQERNRLKTLEGQYQQSLTDANAATTDLEKFQQSPAWGLLPHKFQASASSLVGDVRTQMNRENDLAPKVLARSQAAGQRAEVAINRAVVSLRQAALVLSRNDDLEARLAKMDAAREAHKQAGAEIRSDVTRLVQEADRLQGELELMSSPDYVGVEQLFESWRTSLMEVQHIFQRLASEQMMADAQDALTTRVNTDRMREGLSYHQKQLEQLDQQQKARMVEVLSQSSEWLQQTLATLPHQL